MNARRIPPLACPVDKFGNIWPPPIFVENQNTLKFRQPPAAPENPLKFLAPVGLVLGFCFLLLLHPLLLILGSVFILKIVAALAVASESRRKRI